MSRWQPWINNLFCNYEFTESGYTLHATNLKQVWSQSVVDPLDLVQTYCPHLIETPIMDLMGHLENVFSNPEAIWSLESLNDQEQVSGVHVLNDNYVNQAASGSQDTGNQKKIEEMDKQEKQQILVVQVKVMVGVIPLCWKFECQPASPAPLGDWIKSLMLMNQVQQQRTERLLEHAKQLARMGQTMFDTLQVIGAKHCPRKLN